MKNDKFFNIVLLVALCVIVFDIAAAIFAGVKLTLYSMEAISLSPVIFGLLITVFAVNASLIALIVVYLILRKA